MSSEIYFYTMGLVKNVLYAASHKKFLKLFKSQIILPYYHIVKDNPVAHIENLYKYKTCQQFETDIDLLLAHYKPVDPKDLISGQTLLSNSFLLTFDDGLQEVYTHIYPILKKKNIKAIFFINPDFIDNKVGLYKHYISFILSHLDSLSFENTILEKIGNVFGFSFYSIEDFKKKILNIDFSDRNKVHKVFELLGLDVKQYLDRHQPYLTCVQIEEMMADGFYFGGHTMSHATLNRLSHHEQKGEIIESVDWIKKRFQVDYSLFAFPYSDKSISNQLIRELFEYDSNIKLFGNSGIKSDVDHRIFQRFSLENPARETGKQIVTENLYKYYNKIVGKYHIKRA